MLPNVDLSDLHFKEGVNYNVLKSIMDTTPDEKLHDVIKERYNELVPLTITTEDMIASISYLLNLDYGIGKVDDIDHLGNRRIRCVGELLQNQFRIGLTRLERVVRERMTIQDTTNINKYKTYYIINKRILWKLSIITIHGSNKPIIRAYS